MSKKVIVIGSGFSGLSAAVYLAKNGFQVEVFEKNNAPGGRASILTGNGFKFDMGPSWYWMPGIFEDFFKDFGHIPSDFYKLVRLNPSYRVFFGKQDYIDIPADENALFRLFEILENGGGLKLKNFLDEAAQKYETGIRFASTMTGNSPLEIINGEIISKGLKLDIFSSVSASIRKYFRNPRIIRMLEFPVLFLGATPQKIPALYSLMNYADLKLGTWYPVGGMYSVVEGIVKLAENLGVQFHFQMPVEQIEINNNKAVGIHCNKLSYKADYIIASCDYHHAETLLPDEKYKNYNQSYWNKKMFAPSAVLFYLGINKKIHNLLHHNLFFDVDFNLHANEIYNTFAWPKEPCLYISCSSKTDETVAPSGYDNIVVLIPVSAGLTETPEIIEHYYRYTIDKIEKLTGESLAENVIYKKAFSVSDFKSFFNAYKGNAYGLANTLMQTAFLKPKLHNKKIKNLLYAGQLTVPGPGVPPALLSGKLAANEIIKTLATNA